ncbi:RNA-binding protein [Thermoplasmatales archaeon ex4484_30]|nr:MAG: S1 RNA-binding domain-containing protein [Thermoplasmata archaeon]OYT61531.1 MAG: RNA-binding protein [Thermoplasmatales archaeon ex4484_30]
MMKDGSIVFPGEKVATAEEVMAGEGTYEEDGIIRASVIGKLKIDRKALKAIVQPLTSMPLLLKKGDTVICEVKQIGDAMVIVRILHVAGIKRQIAGEKDGAIHISNVSQEFVEDLSKKFRIGDIVRAKIIKAEPAIQLSTKGREFGVIKAFCTNCRNALIRKTNTLECPVCGRKEERKVTDDYGMGELDKVIKNGDKNKKGE